jgi:hypothetical protein
MPEVEPARDVAPLSLLVFPAPRRAAGMFTDRRVLVIGLIHVSGMAMAAAWLITRILARAPGTPVTIERAGAILRSMQSGPEFYLFAGVAMLASVLLLIAARPWIESPELDDVRPNSRRLARDPGAPPRQAPSGLRRIPRLSGSVAGPSRSCGRRESILATCWIVLAIFAPVTILVLIFPRHDSPAHGVLWAYAAVDAALSIGMTAKAIRRTEKYARRFGDR